LPWKLLDIHLLPPFPPSLELLSVTSIQSLPNYKYTNVLTCTPGTMKLSNQETKTLTTWMCSLSDTKMSDSCDYANNFGSYFLCGSGKQFITVTSLRTIFNWNPHGPFYANTKLTWAEQAYHTVKVYKWELITVFNSQTQTDIFQSVSLNCPKNIRYTKTRIRQSM
jgi:hypothetical protein